MMIKISTIYFPATFTFAKAAGNGGKALTVNQERKKSV